MQELSPFAALHDDDDTYDHISHLAFSSNGLLAIGGDGAVVWNLAGQGIPDEPVAEFPGAFLSPLAWSPNNQSLAVGQEEGVAVYAIATQEQLSLHQQGETVALAWSPSGDALLSCSEYGDYALWQPATGTVKKLSTVTVAPAFITFLPNRVIVTNPFLLTPRVSRWQLQLWKSDLTAIEHLVDDGERRCDHYTCVASAPTSACLALGTEAGLVHLWHLREGTAPTLSRVISFHQNSISGLAWSPDEQLLATGSVDGHVAVWNKQGELRYHTGARQCDQGIRALAWWKDLLAVGDAHGQVQLYRVPASNEGVQ